MENYETVQTIEDRHVNLNFRFRVLGNAKLSEDHVGIKPGLTVLRQLSISIVRLNGAHQDAVRQ